MRASREGKLYPFNSDCYVLAETEYISNDDTVGTNVSTHWEAMAWEPCGLRK